MLPCSRVPTSRVATLAGVLCVAILACVSLLSATPELRADAFDRYTNPVLARAPGAEGVKEVKHLTIDLIADNDQVLPNARAALIVVQTNGGRLSKLLVAAAREKVDAKTTVPILLIERFVTYKEGEERTVLASGRNVHLYGGFTFNMDMGQVVPAALGGDLRFAAEGGKVYTEPVGKAKLYLVTKPLPAAAPKKTARQEIGATFEPRYFNGTYKLYDDGRRSGTLTLKVIEGNDVAGAYYSDKDGQKYEVKGKVGSPLHTIRFTVKFPRVEQDFEGWMFTGDGKALAGSSRMQDRETGFYAVRQEEE